MFLRKQCELVYWFTAGKTYPKNWFSMVMFQHKIVKRLLINLAKVIEQLCARQWGPDDVALWLSFFQGGFAFLDSSCLRLESFSASKAGMIKDQ